MTELPKENISSHCMFLNCNNPVFTPVLVLHCFLADVTETQPVNILGALFDYSGLCRSQSSKGSTKNFQHKTHL